MAANGAALVAAGTEFTAAGASRPFAEVSADAGATWTAVQLPVPDIGPGTGTTVTALTAAGGGFTAAGTYLTESGPEVVVWTLPPGKPVTAGSAWAAVTPQGPGLAGASTRERDHRADRRGRHPDRRRVHRRARAAAADAGSPQQPTLWQSPIRY